MRCGVRGDGKLATSNKPEVVQWTKVGSSRTETSDAIAGQEVSSCGSGFKTVSCGCCLK